ncbi:MAG: QueT transporter family protein [Clostridia bacterium]|nr:QueT transporter family protein [Clostridia bacterium]MBT7122276.1 QueT transporter family protein [Clostridia bacterium]
MKRIFTPRFIAEAGIIAALYFALTMAAQPISFGPLQVRISEALCILPFFTPAAIPGLFIGVVLSNLVGSPLGPYDIVFGSLATLVAAAMTYGIFRFGKKCGDADAKVSRWFLPLPAVVVNAFVVAAILQHYIPELANAYWVTAGYVAAGQVIACYVLGIPLFFLLNKHKNTLFRRI